MLIFKLAYANQGKTVISVFKDQSLRKFDIVFVFCMYINMKVNSYLKPCMLLATQSI